MLLHCYNNIYRVLMNYPLTKKIDCASEHIVVLQSLMRKLSFTHKGLEQGLLQQYLDEESLYIKQIPRVRCM